jgi:hypothetical protein
MLTLILIIAAIVAAAAALILWRLNVKNLASRAWLGLAFVSSLLDRLNGQQRRRVYRVVLAGIVAVAVALGVDAKTATDWVETGVLLVTTLGPILAHHNVTDD